MFQAETVARVYARLLKQDGIDEEAVKHELIQACAHVCAPECDTEVQDFLSAEDNFFLIPNETEMLVGSLVEMLLRELHFTTVNEFFNELLFINGPRLSLQQAYTELADIFSVQPPIPPYQLEGVLNSSKVNAEVMMASLLIVLVESLCG